MDRTNRLRLIALSMLAIAGASGLESSASAQTCSCSCDSYIPPGLDVTAVEMNESGAGPTQFLGATVTTAMKHATFFPFSAPMTITHVCVSLRNSVSPPESGAIEFASPNPFDSNLPSTPFVSQPILIQPDLSGIHPHQIIELNPPVFVNSPTWVIVSYPQAQGGFGHQGARARLFNDAAVYRADTGLWRYYDQTGDPGYVGATPIIRPLTLAPAPVTCPGTGILENEPNCGLPTDTVNGGCNSTPPVFIPLSCGDTVCGTAEFDGVTRDTDWYELTLASTQQIHWSAYAEFDVQILILEQDPNAGPCAGYIVHGNATAPAYQTASLSAVLPAGTYWLFLAPQFTAPIPCGLAYTATIDCCALACPPASILEAEPCGSNLNAGCAPGGSFDPAQCGTTICGELYADQGQIDEDWYEVSIPDLDGNAMGFFVLTIDAALPVELGLHDTSCSLPFPVVYNAIVAPACTPTQLFAGVPAPGIFHIVVRPTVATGYPCGTNNRYTLQIDAGVDCAPQRSRVRKMNVPPVPRVR